MAVSPHGDLVVTAGLDHMARVWDARTGKQVTKPLEHRAPATAVAFSPDGHFVVTTGGDHSARVWSAQTAAPGTELVAYPRSRPMLLSGAVGFDGDDQFVVTAVNGRTARVWNVCTGEPVTELPMATGSIDDWRRRARCGPFVLEGGELVANQVPCP